MSRLDPEMTREGLKEYVRELLGVDCDVEHVKANLPSYSSFVITVSKSHKAALLDPDAWAVLSYARFMVRLCPPRITR